MRHVVLGEALRPPPPSTPSLSGREDSEDEDRSDGADIPDNSYDQRLTIERQQQLLETQSKRLAELEQKMESLMEGGGASAGQSHRESPLLDGWDGSDDDEEDDDDHPYQGPRTKSPLPKTRPNSAPSKQPKGKRNKLQASVSAGKLLQAAREVSAEKPWRRRPPSAPPKRRPPPPPPKPDPPWKRETKSGWARAAVEKDPASHKRQHGTNIQL